MLVSQQCRSDIILTTTRKGSSIAASCNGKWGRQMSALLVVQVIGSHQRQSSFIWQVALRQVGVGSTG